MRILSRTADNNSTIAYQIGVPSVPQIPDIAPRMSLELLNLQQPELQKQGISPCISNTGIYSGAAQISELSKPQPMWPFNYGNAWQLISEKLDDEWALYSFEATALRLRLDYYSLEDPKRRGMIEIGHRFSLVQFAIRISRRDLSDSILEEIPNFQTRFRQYDIQLWRNPGQVQRLCFFWQRQYADCMVKIGCSHIGRDNERRLVDSYEFAGRDYSHPLS